MHVGKIEDMNKIEMDVIGAKGAVKQVVIGPEQGWEDHVLRVMTLAVGGMTPKHQHNWPHINYVLEGQGTLYVNGEIYELSKGSNAYVPGGVEHQFMNTGEESFVFICIVPTEGEF